VSRTNRRYGILDAPAGAIGAKEFGRFDASISEDISPAGETI
jgi:hypothetical protein